jgi:hypothetical protein
VAKARHPRSKAGAKRRSRTVRFPAKYSHDFPVNALHNYLLNAIPADVWDEQCRLEHGSAYAPE